MTLILSKNQLQIENSCDDDEQFYVLKSLAFLGRCTSVGRRHWDVEVYVVIIASVLEQFVIV